MPIYEYLCSNCSHKFELIQKMSDAPSTHCEHCGQDTAIRLVSAAGFQLKGTGWYVTDFKDKPKVKTGDGASKSTADTPTTTTDTSAKAVEPVRTSTTTSGDAT